MLHRQDRNHRQITDAVSRVRFAQSTCAFVRKQVDEAEADPGEYKDMLKVVAFYRKQLSVTVRRLNYPRANFAGLID